MGGSKFCRRDAGRRVKRPCKCAVIGESALVRDVRNRAVGIAQGLRTGGDARLGDQLDGCKAEDSLDDARKSRSRRLGDAGKARRRKPLPVIRLQVK